MRVAMQKMQENATEGRPKMQQAVGRQAGRAEPEPAACNMRHSWNNNNVAKHRNMLQIRSLSSDSFVWLWLCSSVSFYSLVCLPPCPPPLSLCPSVTQCATSTGFKVIAGDAAVSAHIKAAKSKSSAKLLPKMPPKGKQRVRERHVEDKPSIWRKKEQTHTHTYTAS